MINSVLALNASFEPINVISINRAITLILTGVCEAVENTERVYHSAKLSIPVPSVIRRLEYVKVPSRKKVPLNRRNVVARDRGICGYCLGHGNEIDHIVPRSRGGKHVWENVVTSCRPCNSKKDDHLLSEIGWTLKITPKAPNVRAWVILGIVNTYKEWLPYLEYLGVDIPKDATYDTVEEMVSQ
jgi:5-methylcytosine-specific restriction endonuclease McrA